jgi:hypothetical protein
MNEENRSIMPTQKKRAAVARRTPQSEAMMRMAHANVHLAKGMTRAATVGLENFLRKIEHGNILHPDVAMNGLVSGMVAGWTAAMYEGARLTEEAFLKWLSLPEEAPLIREAFKRSPGK